MNIQNIKNNKPLLMTAGLVILVLAYFLFFRGLGKIDDWQYSGPFISEERAIIYGLIFLGLIILSWLSISIYMMMTGQTDRNGVNAKRRLGWWLLMMPLLLVAITVLMIFIGSSLDIPFIILTVPIAAIALLIWGIRYAVKTQAKIAIIPMIFMILILPLASVFFIGSFGVMNASKFSASTGMALDAGSMRMAESQNLGFSVGGAKDINNFRENIANNYLPIPTDITYEGLFYDYYFDTGEEEICTELFCPSYSYAVSNDPISGEEEYYLSVGLNSGIKESDFQRKKLNLVIVMDISGSMSSKFNTYYYDQFGKRQPIEGMENETDSRSKMAIARESVVDLLGHLNSDDRFGMVLFDDDAYLAKPLSLVGDTDMAAIKGHIRGIQPQGGTYFEAGYKEGTALFEEFLDADQSEYENRIIFITDAMPNIGQISEEGLFGMTKTNAYNKVYTTFIGVGVDFNTELIEYITKVRGANYYSVHSAKQFQTRMDDEFEYMVTPLVFDLNLQLDAEGYEIEKVFGSPEADEATGEIMKVNTLFPSKTVDSETRGGIVILKLKKTSPDGDLKLKVSYEDRTGAVKTNEADIEFGQESPDYYENTGIRKAILLSRYASLMKDWINDERASYTSKQPVTPAVNKIEGIVIPPDDLAGYTLNKWERQSVPLQVSSEYKAYISDFKEYFKDEMDAIGDSTLSKEITVMGKLTGET